MKLSRHNVEQMARVGKRGDGKRGYIILSFSALSHLRQFSSEVRFHSLCGWSLTGRYRVKVTHGSLEEGSQDVGLGRLRSAVDNAQLAVETQPGQYWH